MLCIFLEYALRTAINDREGLTLTRRRSSRHPASHLSDLDYADDIVLFADMIQVAELLLHKVESASKSTGLFLNPSKTKYIHIYPSANDSVHSSDGSQIENVEFFNISDPIQTLSMTSSAETNRHGQQFTSLTKFGERPSADSPNRRF